MRLLMDKLKNQIDINIALALFIRNFDLYLKQYVNKQTDILLSDHLNRA